MTTGYVAAQELLSLAGKVALITGAARGIGQAVALRLASAGAAIVACDRTAELCEETVGKVGELGGRIAAIGGDLADVASISRVAAEAKAAFGTIDVLVNNAALRGFSTWDGLGEDDWDRYMAVNSKAPFFMSQAVGKIMAAQPEGGAIVSIASTAAIRPVPQKVDYNIAKAGIVAMTRSLAVELGRHRIRVNAVGPGATDTLGGGAQQQGDEAKRFKDAWLARLALPVDYADPDDIARAVLFLASPASRYVTGQVLFVDAGYLAG